MTDDNFHAEKFIDIPLEIVTVGSQPAILSPTNDQVHDLLTTIQPIVEEITGLASRWSRRTRIAEAVDQEGFPKFSGRKEWNCDITIHRSRLASSWWYGTALHEMLHSVSVGLNDSDYRASKGYEEGVVEQATRILLPDVMAQLDIGDYFTDRLTYEPFVIALERLRKRANRTARTFYLDLLFVPLNLREKVVVQWIIESERHLNAEIVLSQMHVVFGVLKR